MIDTWYVSFAGEDRFLGGVYTDASDKHQAIERAVKLLKRNYQSVLPALIFGLVMPERFKDRLLSKEDMEELKDMFPDASKYTKEECDEIALQMIEAYAQDYEEIEIEKQNLSNFYHSVVNDLTGDEK